MSITLYERVDIEKLMEVLNCDNIPFNPLTDESEWFEQMKKQLIRYSQQKRTNNGIKVTYKQKNKHGRFCTPFGQQTIQRDIRKYIGSYRDYDFSNCHPVILDILFKNHGIFDTVNWNDIDTTSKLIDAITPTSYIPALLGIIV